MQMEFGWLRIKVRLISKLFKQQLRIAKLVLYVFQYIKQLISQTGMLYCLTFKMYCYNQYYDEGV